MRKNIQIVHQRHIHKKHLHKYINHRGIMSLNHIMGRHHHSSQGKSCCNSGGSLKNRHTHKKPLHFKSLF